MYVQVQVDEAVANVGGKIRIKSKGGGVMICGRPLVWCILMSDSHVYSVFHIWDWLCVHFPTLSH